MLQVFRMGLGGALFVLLVVFGFPFVFCNTETETQLIASGGGTGFRGAGGTLYDVAGAQQLGVGQRGDASYGYHGAQEANLGQEGCETYVCVDWLDTRQTSLLNEAAFSGLLGQQSYEQAQDVVQRINKGAFAGNAAAASNFDSFGIGIGTGYGGSQVGYGNVGQGAFNYGEGYGAITAGSNMAQSLKEQEALQQRQAGYKTLGNKCTQYQCFRGYTNIAKELLGPNYQTSLQARQQVATAMDSQVGQKASGGGINKAYGVTGYPVGYAGLAGPYGGYGYGNGYVGYPSATPYAPYGGPYGATGFRY